MKKVLKTILIIVGALVGLFLLFLLLTNLFTLYRLNRQYEVSVRPITIPEDESARSRGEHLVRVVSVCTGCHGQDLGGMEFINAPFLAQIYAPNLTSGEGGKASQYRGEDWVRAIRHGLNPSGRPLFFMPSQAFNRYSEEDIAAIAAYIESVPPVDRETPPSSVSVFGRVLFALGSFGDLPAELIDHSSEPPPSPPAENTAEFGEFLVTVALCKDCHSENLAGGEVSPDDPPAPNLTPGGELAGWTEDDFFDLIRTGIHPGGRRISTVMPWETYRNMTDSEIGAIWRFLQEQPALQTNE